MSQDIKSERRWRKHTAFILAHEAAAACGKLRKVNTGNKSNSAASGAVSRYEAVVCQTTGLLNYAQHRPDH